MSSSWTLGSSARLLLLLLAAIICSSAGNFVDALKDDTPTCRDEEGKPVDWFIAYKFPMVNHTVEPYTSGAGYAYIVPSEDNETEPEAIEDDETFLDKFRQLLHEYLCVPLGGSCKSKRDQPGWTVAKYPINHKNSMIMRSVAPAYSRTKPQSLNWIFYNDHPAKPLSNNSKTLSPSQSRAHAKGSVLIDDASGDAMWLSHTVPRFPTPVEDPLLYPETGYMFGQTFVCLNFDARAEGSKVAKHLSNMFALVYNSNVTPKLRQTIPEMGGLKLEDEKSGLGKRDRVASLDQMIKTRGGREFELFSKSASLQGDLYAGWLADRFDSSMYVETWRNGRGNPLKSDCPEGKHQVNNIKRLHLIKNSNQMFSWSYYYDHSKWGITDSQEEAVVCLADINRMESQFKRGGGAICLKDPKVWAVFSGTIKELEPCKVKTKAAKKGSNLSVARKRFVEKIKQSLF